MALAQLVDVAVELLSPREGKRRHELTGLDLHLGEGGVELACRLAQHPLDGVARVPGVARAEGLLAKLGQNLVEARRALRAHGGESPHELDRQVVGHGVEQPRLLLVDRVLALPAHLDDRDDLAVEPHGHGDEAGEGRQELGLDLYDLASVLVDDLSRCQAPRAQGVAGRRRDAQADSLSGARGERLDRAPEVHEARDPGRVDVARQAAQVKPVGTGEVHDRAVGVERLVELLEHAREELADVRCVEGVEHDVEGAREALVRSLEVVDRPVVLTGVGEPSVCRVGNEQVRLAWCRHRLASDRHGAKLAVEAAAHGGSRGAVERKRQVLHRGRDTGRSRRVGVV